MRRVNEVSDATDARVALVTGGATGIGRATCIALASMGVGTIVICYSRSREEASSLAGQVCSMGARALELEVDVSSRSSVDSAFSRVTSELGRLDFLVNNAGVTELVPFNQLDDLSQEIWDKVFSTNLLGAFWCSVAARELLEKTRGSIVNLGSIAGYRAVGSSIPYGVTKAGLLQLTRSLAIAMAPNVRVNSISPGTVLSGWHEKLPNSETFRHRAEAEAETVPLKSLAGPEEIAQAIVSLLQLEFVTGQDLIVDGGKSLLY